MIKMIMLGRRNPAMTRDDFQRYWREQHVPLVKSTPDFWGYVRRYTRNFVFTDESLVSSDDYDAVAEFWFDSVADANAAFSTRGYLDVIHADELKFVDITSNVIVILSTEESDVGGPQ